jgi:hypothetical protein
MPKTVYLDTVLLNHVLRGVAYSSPSTIYVALFTTAPTPTLPGIEVSGGAYARQPATFTDPVAGTTANSADVVFPTATAPWGTVEAYALMDAASGGNMLYFASFAAPRLIDVNDDARFPAGQLTVTES